MILHKVVRKIMNKHDIHGWLNSSHCMTKKVLYVAHYTWFVNTEKVDSQFLNSSKEKLLLYEEI